MSQIQKFRAHESLGIESAAEWNVKSAGTIADTTIGVEVSNYHMVSLITSEDIYYTFASSSSDAINTSNDLYLIGGDTIYTLKIPHGIGSTIYFQVQRKTSSNSTLRYVLS